MKKDLSCIIDCMKLKNLEQLLNQTLRPEDFEAADISLNGLQVGNRESEVHKACFAVDACMDSFEAASQAGSDVLVVHHGLFWGHPLAITGTHYERVKFLMDHNLALYACHLPLDAHPVLGNNAQIASALGLKHVEPFAEYHGKMIGFKGILPEPMPMEKVGEVLGFGQESYMIEFGRKLCRTVGIVSGSAADDVSQAIDDGLDLFITGERSHQVYHLCEENHMNMLCLGHYNTETFGVRALMGVVAPLGIETAFVDVPTGL